MRKIIVSTNRLLDGEEIHLLNSIMREYNNSNNPELLLTLLSLNFVDSIS